MRGENEAARSGYGAQSAPTCHTIEIGALAALRHATGGPSTTRADLSLTSLG
jgi:hypothetical protein